MIMRFFILLTLIFTSSLLAHKLNIFAYDEGGKLYLHSYFAKSSPCKGCQVRIIDNNERELVKTVTNKEGKISITLPASAFSIVVEAGMGHQQELSYTANGSKEEIIDSEWSKIVFGLIMVFLLFGVLIWFKKRPSL